jgi:glucose/arabinose dehydrogenase
MSVVKRPVAVFPPRSAPMDMVFFDESANASQFRNDALVALHGSWATDDDSRNGNGDPSSRREPKLVLVEFTNAQAGKVVEFMTGFQLPDGRRWARPVGVAIGPDGDIYFTSDDGIQGLYRIKYTPQ